MKKFLTTLAVLTAFATPAFAQSFDPDNGTGNVLLFAHAPTDHSGKNAYAPAPQTAPTRRRLPKRPPLSLDRMRRKRTGLKGRFTGLPVARAGTVKTAGEVVTLNCEPKTVGFRIIIIKHYREKILQ